MDTGHFFGPGSDPTYKRPTRDPTRLDSTQMQCVTLQTTILQYKYNSFIGVYILTSFSVQHIDLQNFLNGCGTHLCI